MRTFIHHGEQVTVTNRGPHATVLTKGGAIPLFTSEVLCFEKDHGLTRMVQVPIGTFETSSESDLSAIYEGALLGKAA